MKEDTRKKLKRARMKAKAVGIIGAGLGAAAAHTAINAARASKGGKDFSSMPGATRAEYLAPVILAAGVGAYAANYKRKQAMEKHLQQQSQIARLTNNQVKTASFNTSQWVLDSLIY